MRAFATTSQSWWMLIAAFCAGACSSSHHAESREQSPNDWGQARARIVSASEAPIAFVYFEAACASGFTTSAVIALEAEGVPDWVDPSLQGQPFADYFFVAPIGTCTLTAVAMQDPTMPSPLCAPAKVVVDVVQGSTTEKVLPIFCQPFSTGAVDSFVTLNFAPVIVEANYILGPEIDACTEGKIEISVEDPEGKSVSVFWTILLEPPGANYVLVTSDSGASIVASTPGYYVVLLTLTDPDGGITELEVPFFVSFVLDGEDCDPQNTCIPILCNDGNPCSLDQCLGAECVHTTFAESCDGVDNDCDGIIDNDCTCPITGDVNESGAINVADAQCTILATLWALAGIPVPAPACLAGKPENADVNCDASINVSDVVLVIRFALGLGVPAPLDLNTNGCVDACEANPCGNGLCEPPESCAVCSGDCGACP